MQCVKIETLLQQTFKEPPKMTIDKNGEPYTDPLFQLLIDRWHRQGPFDVSTFT
jgi:hypothetical protein